MYKGRQDPIKYSILNPHLPHPSLSFFGSSNIQPQCRNFKEDKNHENPLWCFFHFLLEHINENDHNCWG